MRVGALAAAVLVFVLSGCGSGGDDDEAVPSSGGTTSATPSAATPADPAPAIVYVESETCRSQMAPLVELMLANYSEESLAYTVFDNRVDQLTKRIDAAVAPCTSQVNNPARRAMYQFTLARLQWMTCDEGQCMDDVTKSIQTGISSARKVEFALEDAK